MDELQCLVEFYNLHLKSGRTYNGVSIPSWKAQLVEESGSTVKIEPPDEKERGILLKFFSDNMPEITSLTVAEIVEEYGGIVPYDDLLELSLGGYQLNRIKKAVQVINQKEELSHDAKTLLNLVKNQELTESWLDSESFLDFLEENEDLFSWFESDDFLGFADEYAHVKSVIDNYIDRKIIKADLKWLDENVEKYNISLMATNRNDREDYLIWSVEVPKERSFSLDEWKMSLTGLCGDMEQHGLCLGSLMHDIYMGLISMLEDEPDVHRCAFEGGKRIPKCENVFISSHKNMKYCSTKCYNRARVARRVK